MTTLKLLGWILTHVARSRRRYRNVDSTSNAVSRLTDRFERVKRAAGDGGGIENRPAMAKALLQLAGIALRTVEDLRLDHPSLIPQPPPNANDLPVPLAWRPPGSDFPFRETVPTPTPALPPAVDPTDKGDQFPPPTPKPIPKPADPQDVPDWPSDPTVGSLTSPVPGGVTDPATEAGRN